ncbi:hypothetical protein SNEBB_003566 [Seison nebaliae]|nr:hypothetical protein SNEBB_003566 [Seison nebaliae]
MEVTSLIKHLCSLNEDLRLRIICTSSGCYSLFKDLPSICKRILIGNIYQKNLKFDAITCMDLYGDKNLENVELMVSIGIVLDDESDDDKDENVSFYILDMFQQCFLKEIVYSNRQNWMALHPEPPPKPPKEPAELISYCQRRWDCLLNYLVKGGDSVADSTRNILIKAGLMKEERNETDLPMSSYGFQYLLMDRSTQVFHFLLHLLSLFEQRALNIVEYYEILCQISLSKNGMEYSCKHFDDDQLTFLQILRDVGVVHQRTSKLKRFNVTSLAEGMLNGIIESDNAHYQSTKRRDDGFIICETNYRVYAYTNSDVGIEMLATFINILQKLPGFVVGVLTRSSVNRAFDNGITPAQIINCLTVNCHEKVANDKPVVPSIISDQIHLWGKERCRFQFNDCYKYSIDEQQAHCYISLRDFARASGFLLMSDDDKKTMFVKADAHDAVKTYYKSNIKSDRN